MIPAPDPSQIPAELAALASQPRVLVRRAGPPRKEGACVVYWMQRAVRAVDNPALDVAIEAANILGIPVVIYFGVIPNYPNANLRHYHFLQQGLRDAQEDAAARGVGFIVRRAPDKLEAFLEEVRAALLIGDENPCREPERWRSTLALRLRIPYWTVDADIVVPSRVFNRSFALLHHFRPRLNAELPKYLVAPKCIAPLHAWSPRKCPPGFSLSEDITAGFKNLDRSIKPVNTFTGGTRSALKRLREFAAHDLAAYDERRNHPEIAGTSRLSPYLHFGNIGPLTIALAVEKAVASGKISSKTSGEFLEQLIGWRELAVLFVRHEPSYDSWECAAPWARKTLLDHASDPKPYKYTFAQLERAETHDDLWNAAQREMTRDRLDAQLHAHVLGQENPGVGARSRHCLRLGRHPQRQIPARWPRSQRLRRHCLGDCRQVRSSLVRSSRLRPRSSHDRRIDGEEIRLCSLYAPAQRILLIPAFAALPPLYPQSHGALFSAVL